MDYARKATVTYTGDGVQLKYSFPFDYLRKAFVKVQNIAGDNIKDLVLGTDYSVDDKQVTLVTPIASGNHLKIYRSTTTEPLVEWQDASVLRSADLSLQEIQLLHLSEETLDRVQEGGLSTDPQDSDVWDARFKRMKNLLDPKEDGDAVTLRYINNSRDGIIGAITATGDTQVKRVTATGDTQDARVVSTGNTYVETMTGLKDVATTKASESSDSAKLSKAWAMSSTSPDNTDSKSSKTWAEEAKLYAGNAKVSEANAKTSETNAKSSETNANSYMTNANAYMTNASDSATKAKTSETNAATSERNAKASETASASSANAADTSAQNASQSSASAGYFASQAGDSAKAAKTSETNAKASETNAEASAIAAKTSADNASDSASRASTSEANAKASAKAAKTSETNAKASETNAAKSAQEAKVHADNAAQHDPKVLIAEAHHYIKRNTAYNVGDVLTSPNLPYGTIIVVTQAGTTGADEPDWDSIKNNMG